MVSENVKKLVDCEKKAKEMVNKARIERSDLLALSVTDAEIAVEKIRKDHEKIIEMEKEREEKEVSELVDYLKSKKEEDIKRFEVDIEDGEELVDDIVATVSGIRL